MEIHNEADNEPERRAGRASAGLARLATQRAVGRQRRVWSRRVGSWDQHGSASLGKVTSALVGVAAVKPGDTVVDLGCGTGQITIPLAQQGADVLGVDVSPAMANRLRAEASRLSLPGLTAVAVPIEELDLPSASVDVIVSSYALHHLRDADKAALVRSAYGWLRPGGRLVIADMMFGRGGSPRDREIIRTKIAALAKKGPGGWWRIFKNVARYLLRVQERPISLGAWTALLEDAGFLGVTASAIVAEAGMITGQRPVPTRPSASRRQAAAARSGPR